MAGQDFVGATDNGVTMMTLAEWRALDKYNALNVHKIRKPLYCKTTFYEDSISVQFLDHSYVMIVEGLTYCELYMSEEEWRNYLILIK